MRFFENLHLWYFVEKLFLCATKDKAALLYPALTAFNILKIRSYYSSHGDQSLIFNMKLKLGTTLVLAKIWFDSLNRLVQLMIFGLMSHDFIGGRLWKLKDEMDEIRVNFSSFQVSKVQVFRKMQYCFHLFSLRLTISLKLSISTWRTQKKRKKT